VSVITGAAAGLGRAIATLFADEGAFVFLADINQDQADAAATAIRNAGGGAHAVYVDVGKECDVQTLAKEIRDRFASIDILVNNAGNLIRKDFKDLGDSDWARMLDTHLWGTLRTTRALLPLLQRTGAEDTTSVVNLSSLMAANQMRQFSSYSTAKAGIAGLSRSLAVEFAPYAIRVNYICPGFVPTEMTRQYSRSRFAEALIRNIPMRRFGTPEEIAKVALFLGSNGSSYITGQGITVDGGMGISLV
jgi:gluconate 5-dehydrogenase